MKQTENLGLNLTDMTEDGNQLFDFERDLNQPFEIIDEAIGELQARSVSAGIPPSNCKNLRVEKSGTNYLLNWNDPKDTVINDLTLCTWWKTVIVKKSGSYPETPEDGTVVLTNTVRDKYSKEAYVDEIDDDTETEYYYRAFPYSVNGVCNLDPQNYFGTVIYEFILDTTNSNPKTCIKYAGINEDFTPAHMDYENEVFDYGSWKDTFIMSLARPCMLKTSGVVDYYLNPDDLTQKEDGTPSDVSNESYDGNAMVQFAQFWIKAVQEGAKIHVYIANKQVDENYKDYMHYGEDGTLKQYVYRAIYDGSNISNKIRSLSGKTICRSLAGNTQIANARANGSGWNVDAYADRVAINFLLMLIGKSLDTQTTFGTGRYTGYVNESNTNQLLTTGTNDKKGMFYGDNNNGCVTVFFIQNWWGNIWKITNGLIQKNGKLYVKFTYGTQDGSSATGYNQTDSTGYIDTGVTLSGTISQLYIKSMKLVSGYGLVPSADSGGSSSTYFCDGLWSNSSLVGFARFGGSPYDGLLVGAFALAVDIAVSHSNWPYGVALSYK